MLLVVSNKMEIKIKKVRNGYFVEFEDDEIATNYVFEEKEDDSIDERQMFLTKNKVESFKDVIEFLENCFGLDCVNDGDYYLEHKIVKRNKNE